MSLTEVDTKLPVVSCGNTTATELNASDMSAVCLGFFRHMCRWRIILRVRVLLEGPFIGLAHTHTNLLFGISQPLGIIESTSPTLGRA